MKCRTKNAELPTGVGTAGLDYNSALMEPAALPPQPSDASPAPARRSRRPFLTLLKIVVTLAGLWLVLRALEFSIILDALRQVRLAWLAVGAALIALSLVVRAYRWHLVLHGVGSSIRLGRLVELYLVGSFFNAFLPSGLGGDVVRAAEAAQNVEASVAVGTVLVDRLSGLLALFAMALVALPFRPAGFPSNLAWTIGAVCVVGLIVGFVLVDGSLLHAVTQRLPFLQQLGGGFFERLARTVDSCRRPALAGALLVSVVFNLMQIGWWAATGRALGLSVPLGYYLLIVPLMSLALLVPSIGGLGVRESLAPLLFSGAGVAPEQAVALTLLVFGLERVASLLGAPVYLYGTLRRS